MRLSEGWECWSHQRHRSREGALSGRSVDGSDGGARAEEALRRVGP